MPFPASAPVATSALTPAYARLTEVFPGLRITELAETEEPPQRQTAGSPPPGSRRADAALDAFLAWDDAQVLRDYGQQARPDVVASFGLHRYAWPACLLFTVPWFLHRRVPRLPVTDVAFQRTLGRMAVRVTDFACLPGDPAAALPGARVVPDEEALRAEVRAAVADHLGPVLDRLRTADAAGPARPVGHGDGRDRRGPLVHRPPARRGARGRCAELELLLPGTTAPYVGSAASVN